MTRAAPRSSLTFEQRCEQILSLATIRARILARMNAEAERWLTAHRSHVGRTIEVSKQGLMIVRRYACRECSDEFSFRISA